MLGVLARRWDRNLVRPERAFDRFTVDDLRAGPAFEGAQHDRRPAGTARDTPGAGLVLDGADRVEAPVEGLGQRAVDHGRIVTLDEVHVVAVPREDGRDRVVVGAAEHGRPRDLVAVEVQDRQDRAVTGGVEEVDALPRAGEGAGLGLAVSDHARHDELRVVERGAEGVDQRVAELTTFVDRAWRRHAHVTRHPVRGGELTEQATHPVGVPRHLGVHLGVRALEVHVGEDRRAPMPGTGHIDHVGVALADHPVEVRVQEAQTG